MIKPLIILFNTFSVFLFSVLFGDSPVLLTGNLPKSSKPNTEFIAELIVKKGSIGGFAKLQIEVPDGFAVKELESKGGNFSFANNIGKIIWTATPSEPEFTVKMVLNADASATGLKTIAAKYSYVNNNVKEVVEMTPAEITIGDGESPVAATKTEPTSTQATEPTTTSQPLAVETKTETPVSSTQTTPVASTTEQPALSNPTEPNSSIVCSRTITKGSNPNEYNVDVKIKKGAIKGFAKFQEVLPEGCTAKAGNTSGSSFSVSDGKAKFVWVSLPPEEEMTISYKIEKSNLTANDAKLAAGEFSYLENDQSKKVKLAAESISDSGSNSAIVSNTTSNDNTTTSSSSKETQKVATQNVGSDNSTVSNTTNNVIAKKEGNVMYSVQIGAFRAAFASDVLAGKFNISQTIKSEMADGFSKFIIGDFNEYKQAHSQREKVKQNGCASAFVVAYNGAKRITVQEALMITSQKWFK